MMDFVVRKHSSSAFFFFVHIERNFFPLGHTTGRWGKGFECNSIFNNNAMK
jgi:hypothetical protein